MTDPRLIKRATDTGLLDCYPSVWTHRESATVVNCHVTSETGAMVIGTGVDGDAARADALRKAKERFGR